jgi:DNA-directed RNA polymerase subunit beta
LFDQRRYDLERVGRYKLNQRLGLDNQVPLTTRTITKQDVIAVLRHMININVGRLGRDDIDHLGNRRVKTVGELIMNKLRVGLRRMERVVKDRMSTRESAEYLSPVSLVNIRPMVAAIREFFGSSQLSQFMEQTNPLAELTHKRTLSALGPGGLRRERAGFDVRDVHHSHYGRICPIETPEGPNIGLIGRLATYARVNEYGFIETPYRKVVKFLDVTDPRLVGRTAREDVENEKGTTLIGEGDTFDAKNIGKIQAAGIEKVPVVPFVLPEIEYLNADEEDNYVIAQANATLNDLNEFVNQRVSCRFKQGFRMEAVQKVDYIDIAPRQIVGISAALIPFLEHDDANRALMGSNMQRQAVPLLQPEVPIVSTGMEDQAAYDSGQVLVADVAGEVVSVQGDRIVLRLTNGEEKRYMLRKYDRSNQSTCIDQKPIVYKGQQIQPGDVLADSSSTHKGALALGHDVLAAFICWDGGNYEDALLISEEMLRRDKFTSIHIEKHEVEARDTKLGPEEITYDIPNVGEDALKDLDERGVVRVGAEVGPNDILVGKITPKGEKELSPEEKLLRAIFGEQAREVKDSSLRLPHGDRGKVVDVKEFTREEHPDLPAGVERMVRVSIAQRRKLTVGDKMAGRHGNKGVISRVVSIEDMPYLDDGTPVEIILNPTGVPGRMNIGQVLELHLGWAADRLGFRAVTPVFDGADELEIQAELGRAWMIDRAWKEMTVVAWDWVREQFAPEDQQELEDDDEVRRLYVYAWLGTNPAYNSLKLRESVTYARRVILREWLQAKGYNANDVLIFPEDQLALSERQRVDFNAISVSLQQWITAYVNDYELDERLLDDLLTLEQKDLFERANKVMFQTGEPVPHYGKHKLFDGRTGDQFDNHVAVGYVHMLKLAHLVEDKAHARSTGPYSLVTQQPLGGKAQFGGQRFGEMEVWALEAYGAAYTLQEMLTVKSDDVNGRVKTYEAIVKGEPIEEPGIPTSFRVLVKELQSLGLAVEAIGISGEVIRFGKDEDNTKKPQPDTGLMSLGTSGEAN